MCVPATETGCPSTSMSTTTAARCTASERNSLIGSTREA